MDGSDIDRLPALNLHYYTRSEDRKWKRKLKQYDIIPASLRTVAVQLSVHELLKYTISAVI